MRCESVQWRVKCAEAQLSLRARLDGAAFVETLRDGPLRESAWGGKIPFTTPGGRWMGNGDWGLSNDGRLRSAAGLVRPLRLATGRLLLLLLLLLLAAAQHPSTPAAGVEVEDEDEDGDRRICCKLAQAITTPHLPVASLWPPSPSLTSPAATSTARWNSTRQHPQQLHPPTPQPPHVKPGAQRGRSSQASLSLQSGVCSISGYLQLLVRRGARQRLGRRFGVPGRVKCHQCLDMHNSTTTTTTTTTPHSSSICSIAAVKITISSPATNYVKKYLFQMPRQLA